MPTLLVHIHIPESLGLTEEQTKALREKFSSQLVEKVLGARSKIARAAKAKSEVV